MLETVNVTELVVSRQAVPAGKFAVGIATVVEADELAVVVTLLAVMTGVVSDDNVLLFAPSARKFPLFRYPAFTEMAFPMDVKRPVAPTLLPLTNNHWLSVQVVKG